MKDSLPSDYPLLGKPFPSTCLLNPKKDHHLLSTPQGNDMFIDKLNQGVNNNFKRRLTLETPLQTAENIPKRIMLEEDHNIPNQPHTKHHPTTDPTMINLSDDMTMEDYDDNIPPISATSSTDDDPLPSPSESPKPTTPTYQHHSSNTNHNIESWDTLKIINLIENFSTNSLTTSSQSHLAFKLLSKLDRTTLSDITSHLTHNLRRDIVGSLPYEVAIEILKQLDFQTLQNCLLVDKKWNSLITDEFWKYLLIRDNFLYEDETSQNNNKALYQERQRLHSNWINPNFKPRRVTVRGHGPNVVTCLQFDDDKIITGADDNMINIYDPNSGELLRILQGHEGGVWALKYINNQIISGSTDRTVRIWDINTGKCTHVFRGHTSTIRCMEIVDVDGEKLIVSGSRDNTLHVWKLPERGSDILEDYRPEENPYFVCVLQGHTGSVRSVTGHGEIIISGSYDNTVRVWDLRLGAEKFVLRGHTDRIYSTVYDVPRNRCISASMDATIRVWDLRTGECIKILNDHTSLVGLLGLTKDYLISAAADGTLRGWNPSAFTNDFTLHHDNHSAITTFDSNSNILISGSEGQFNVYDLKQGGKLIRSKLLSDAGQIWSAKFRFDKCVVAVERNSQSFIEILDFS
ncbi:hypothetical protein WICPIJ_010108 [Wickerhamomyces pijperi]|uniref:F-box domain-containing protein n=1 Tax=Wickerhamomyces pijperi TaxID=599730 RepID=A0A9P8TB05_WICPI|nr:hypothetical protein WICPIJ_010108 [Wickerhamomyces pijperi]